MRCTGLLFSLLFHVSVWELCAAAHPRLSHVMHYDVVQLQPLKGRMKRSVSSQQKYPDTAEYALAVDGKNFTIYLERNRELLGKQYTLSYYTEDGMKVITPPSTTDHCYYQGHIQNMKDSSVSVGLCSGMRGFVRAENQVYLIEPLKKSLAGDHAVYKQEHLRTKRAAVQYINDTVYDLGPRFSGLYNSRNMNNKAPIGAQRFIEMVLVVDYKEYKKFGSLKDVQKRMLEVANHVDKLYRHLNIRVMLVGLEVWSKGDQIEVSSVPNLMLDRFLKWRQTTLLTRKKHDSAQFVTATDFDGSTVGLAPLNAMCSSRSGAVNEDHSINPLGVASTIAHEMGHNLGMSHDEPHCGCSSRSSQGCIMGESIGLVYPEAFSTCSKVALEMFLQNYDSSCLLDVPKEEDVYGGPVCGNAFVEKGEECDCGTVEECKNPCCNATTCRLTEGSKCAHGECCEKCQLKGAGGVCRHSAHDCDLEEYCTGKSAQCPKDDYKMNGLPCNYGQGYCYNGECPTLKEHCKKLWGPGADVDIDCFRHNTFDKSCARSGSGNCDQQHIKCGKIYCSGGNDFPITREKYLSTFGAKTCYSALEIFDKDSVGMVPTGTKCGTNKVCYNNLCQDLSVYKTKNCSAKCNNHGVCNHENQCHCDAGWAPPHCDVKLFNVANRKDAVIIGVTTSVVILLLITLVIGASVCCKKQKTPFNKQRSFKNTHTYSGQSNPVFQPSSAKNSPRCGPPRISQPTFMESTATQACKSLFSPTPPSRPAPQPPKLAEPRMEQTAKPSIPAPVVPSNTFVPQTKPLLPPSKPLPPSRPLPPLVSKPVYKPKSPPMPPVKPSGTQPAWNAPQVMAPPKVALKPPTKFR
ncbi:disintegrin and metalloproteinase domain-containing protein 8a [Pygocentrus nattereri]|uniref:ADAM metallopeptidase domain 8a n=1 Tax=Pygocentrus nattereri TaxID=42514 RepID=A0AAR2IKV9_PYGNA|nr:disintegrin and metalloproteinase domain-containing protein 8a [Pygocentrus nattereri]